MWEVSEQPKQQKAVCYVCNEVFANGTLRLRPAHTTRTRLVHPACSHGLHITFEKVHNAIDISEEARAQLGQLLGQAASATPLPGDSPAAGQPSASSLKHIEQMDLIPWDRCLECCPCIRKLPHHWLHSVWMARLAVARAIVATYEQADGTAFERLWKILSLFETMILAEIPRRRAGSRGQGDSSLNSILTGRLRAFWNGSWQQLLLNGDCAKIPSKHGATELSEEARTARDVRCIEALVRNEALSKAISRAAEPLTFASGPAVPSMLKAKFLDRTPSNRIDLPTPSPETILELEKHIEAELWSLPKMKGQGPTGTLYEHLRPSLETPDASILMSKVLAMLPSGVAPLEAVRVHRSAKLSAPYKPLPNGTPSSDIRPLACSSALWRVAMRGWARMFKHEVSEAVGPTQYGVSTPGSCTSLRNDLLIDWMMHPNHVLLGIDLENMHNTVDTKRLEEQVANRIPRMAELLQFLRVPRKHTYRDEHGALHSFTVCDGLDQGCPSSNALAPLAIAEQHEELKEYGRVYGLQDDTYVLASRDKIQALCESLPRIFSPCGPKVKTSKCFVSGSAPISSGNSGIQFASTPVVLRQPLPMPQPSQDLSFDDAPAIAMIAKREKFFEKMQLLRDAGLESQLAFLLARTATTGDHNYMAQCQPLRQTHAEQLDSTLFQSSIALLNIDQAEDNLSMARWFLPLRDGGMVLAGAQHTCDALFMDSWARALTRGAARYGLPDAHSMLQSLDPIKNSLQGCAQSLLSKGVSEAESLDTLLALSDGRLARKWRREICSRSLSHLESGAGDDFLICLRESGGPGAGNWLNPPTARKHFFSDQAFVTAVRLRNHLPIFDAVVRCQHTTRAAANAPARRCGCENDRFGNHSLHCQVGGEIVQRHNALRDFVAQNAIPQATGLPALVEQHTEAFDDRRHPDISYQTWRGETSWLDVAVVSPMVRQGGQARHTRAGAAIAAHESMKRRKYPSLSLMPLVCAHLGRAGGDLVTFVRALHRDPDPAARTQAISNFWQSWASTLQQWNVKILSSAGPLLPA